MLAFDKLSAVTVGNHNACKIQCDGYHDHGEPTEKQFLLLKKLLSLVSHGQPADK
jgi:hypothetical protein